MKECSRLPDTRAVILQFRTKAPAPARRTPGRGRIEYNSVLCPESLSGLSRCLLILTLASGSAGSAPVPPASLTPAPHFASESLIRRAGIETAAANATAALPRKFWAGTREVILAARNHHTPGRIPEPYKSSPAPNRQLPTLGGGFPFSPPLLLFTKCETRHAVLRGKQGPRHPFTKII
jgi:hypothetical protein